MTPEDAKRLAVQGIVSCVHQSEVCGHSLSDEEWTDHSFGIDSYDDTEIAIAIGERLVIFRVIEVK